MNAVLLLLVLLALPGGAQPAGRRGAEQPAAQLEALESEYRTLLDRLQEATRQRWQAREAQVAAKERHREQVDRMVREQERLYAEVARAREEHLAREQVFEREEELRNRARDEWRYVVDVIVARTEAHVGAASAGFPLGQADRHRRLVALQDRFPARTHPARRLEGGVGLALDHLRTLTECALEQTTVVAPGNVPLTARVLRMGEVMAWALPADSPPLALLSGEGVQQYRWEEVTNPDVAAALPPLFTRSLSEGRLAGDVPFDVVRSDRTRSLIGGTRLSRAAQLYAFVQAGGVVLVPLVLIIVWALIIVCERTLLYLRRRRGGRRVLAQAPQMLDKGEHERARELVARLGGSAAAGVLDVCLRHAPGGEEVTRKALREHLLREGPVLERHLDTLAVLAGASPLLGLLGTVSGMIRMFDAITRFGTGDPGLLAGGISEALITTQVGLAIAIPVLLVHNHLRNRANRLLGDMDLCAVTFVNRLWPRE